MVIVSIRGRKLRPLPVLAPASRTNVRALSCFYLSVHIEIDSPVRIVKLNG